MATDELRKLAGGKVSGAVRKKFVKRNVQLFNVRLEHERDRQNNYRQQQAEKGRKSGLSREQRLNSGSTLVEPMGQPKGNQIEPSASVSVSDTIKDIKLKSDKGEKALVKLELPHRELANDYEKALGQQWINDAGKWIGRIKREFPKAGRVLNELENAIKEDRVKTTPAQYAEQIWKEFS